MSLSINFDRPLTFFCNACLIPTKLLEIIDSLGAGIRLKLTELNKCLINLDLCA
jgi:hypothetical protein